MKNKIKLKNKFILIFSIFSIVIILLISLLSYIYIEHSFNMYVEKRISESKKDIYNKITEAYKNGKWYVYPINFIGYSAIEQGLLISVKDNLGSIVWNAREYNNIQCEITLANIRNNINKIDPSSSIENIVESYEVRVGESIVGSIEFEYIGPFYYNDSDVILFDMLNDILFVLSLVFLVFSIIIGIIVSSSLSKPILKVVKATNLISEGNYDNKINEESNVEEISELITSVNKMAENINYQENLRKIMTRDISHELRTPLTTMQAQLEAIIDGLWEPSEERLNSIYEELQRLNRLLKSADELYKYDIGNISLNKNYVDISEVINTLLNNFEKDLLDGDIVLHRNISKCESWVDKDKISQVIVNVVSNSIKYTNPGGEIKVGCLEENNMITISIKDTGRGIKEEELNYIFERFYRTDKSRSSSSGGLGVGLTISKTIVEAHHGKIEVKSEVNKGTEFIITLPKLIAT